MTTGGSGRRRPKGAPLAVALAALASLAGCLPPRNPSGEPLAPVPPYVKSVKIDPRTLEPIDEKTADDNPDDARPGAPAAE